MTRNIFAPDPGAILAAGLVFGLVAGPALSNGLGENRPWRFKYKDPAILLELQTLKEGGYLDGVHGGGGGGGGGNGETIINGDQINCTVQAVTAANAADTVIDGITGTHFGVSDSNISSESGGNTSDNSHNDEDGTATNEQSNTGNVSASVDNSDMTSSVGTFTGGGTTTQTADTTQTVTESPLNASVANSVACDGLVLN